MLNEGLATAHGGEERNFNALLNHRIDAASVPVNRNREAEGNPLPKTQVFNEPSDGCSPGHAVFVLTASEAFGNLSKRNNSDVGRGAVLVHGIPFGQGFINTILFGETMTPALQASQLWKLYQAGESTVEAVRGVDLVVQPGEMVAVMGPSGCGKTTLLNILSGIDEPTSGMVAVNGQPLYGISDDARTDLRGQHFGFIFQDFNLLPVLSAVENVELPLLLNGQPPHDARQQAMNALAQVGLGDRSDHRPAELSGGQQQRVAVARAIVHQPAIILCDEPTGNLDTATSSEVMTLLGEMNQTQQTTFLIVTHDADIAAQCQRTITMNDGSILSDVAVPRPEEE